MVTFEPVTVNIGVAGIPPAAAGGGQPAVDPAPAPGKLHYATVGFALELRDAAQKPRFEALRPILLDRILQILGHKSLTELNTVQGRYILRSQLMDVANQMIPGPQAAVTNVYFTQFVVQ
jgi:flagellar basal body-associated protein FliL